MQTAIIIGIQPSFTTCFVYWILNAPIIQAGAINNKKEAIINPNQILFPIILSRELTDSEFNNEN